MDRPPAARSVPVEVPDGYGLVDLTGDDLAGLLCLAGEPAFVDGDTGSYSWCFARIGDQGTSEIRSLVDWRGSADLDDLTRPERPEAVLPALAPLLRVLPPGRYRLTVETPAQVRPVGFTRPGARLWSTDRHGTYAEEIALVGTDPWPPRERSVVAAYRDRVAAGDRPAVVALFPTPESLVGYLLDGHHKMVAGEQAGVPPRVLAVTPERPARPDNAALRRAVPAFVDAVSEDYRQPLTTVLGHLRQLSH
ncbi:hypothetical protein [Plantactinospora sonchi]|uniref:Uncharacterized protein n=1 Tax=Plantactinospora sonchi TaxID=1544735 RepID=A0ABU7RK80_9ACTN